MSANQEYLNYINSKLCISAMNLITAIVCLKFLTLRFLITHIKSYST